MPLEWLQIFIFFILLISLIAYASLDGFDLGVGNLLLFARYDHDRRVLLNSIGPIWDGNSVWIVVSVGILFAGFPKIFATLFTAFYIPMTLLVVGFMFRAMAIEFRSKHTSPFWRKSFDRLFFVASFTVTFMLGLIIGNVIQGIPIDSQGNLTDLDYNFFNFYAVIVAFLNVFLFSLHGAIFLTTKTEGPLYEQIQGWVTKLTYLFLATWAFATTLTFLLHFQMVVRFQQNPELLFFVMLAIAAIFLIPYAERAGHYYMAFVASSLSIALLITLLAIGLYPNIITSLVNPAYSLTIYNASSSHTTLQVIAIVVVIGIPLSFFYLSYLYRTFRGKVKIEDHSY
jgi:cytochrome bd ubiquinol oxidase subunit II